VEKKELEKKEKKRKMGKQQKMYKNRDSTILRRMIVPERKISVKFTIKKIANAADNKISTELFFDGVKYLNLDFRNPMEIRPADITEDLFERTKGFVNPKKISFTQVTSLTQRGKGNVMLSRGNYNKSFERSY